MLSTPVAPARTSTAARGTSKSSQRIAQNLVALGLLYDELANTLTHAPSRRTAGKVRERGTPGIPLNTQVLDIRSDIRTVLASWAALVCEQRSVPAPARDTSALTAFLVGHADWLTGHEAAQDIAAETDDLVRLAWSALSDRRDGSVPVGSCVRPGCEGELVAHLSPRTPTGRAAVVCSADPAHSWRPDAWHTLTSPPPRTARSAGLTAQDIAAGWQIASGTVYWLANTHQWRRRKDGRRVLYDRDDVLTTMRSRDKVVTAP
ncbi:hypothetical protein AB0O76_14195 [Streptomyces sp. NPDC086554]|uniref:hypothetical protein n=1 Tax=Streptomyces sp. NPDC086554 TaxID=3154864 RepID=UPI00343A9443